MAIDIDIFQGMFPEFCDVDDKVLQIWLDEAQSYLCPDNWGDCFDRACLYFTAHNLAQAQARAANKQTRNGATLIQGGTGQIASASAGGLSVSYATPQFATQGNADEVDYSQTPYGIRYLALRDQCLGAGQLVGTVENRADEANRI